MATYQLLVVFKKKYGHCFVQKETTSQQLVDWVNLQKRQYKKSKLPEKRIMLLDELNFEWHEKTSQLSQLKKWQQHYQQLVAFKEKHGHIQLKQKPNEAYNPLARWLGWQNTAYNKGILHPKRRQLLEKLGMVWTNDNTFQQELENQWLVKYEALKTFQEKHQHCWVKKEADLALYNWVNNLRSRKKIQGDKRIALLKTIGFIWDGKEAYQQARQQKWLNRFKEFKEYVKINGHGWVRRKDKQLGNWASSQKEGYRNKTIQKKRYDLLTEAGFIWETKEGAKILERFRQSAGNFL